MKEQLQLLDTKKDWRLDDRTREVGRRGVDAARQALAAAHRAERAGTDPDDAGRRPHPRAA